MCTGTVEVIVCGRGPVGTSEAYEAANAPRCMVWSLYTGHMRAHVAARARVLATWRIRDLDQECMTVLLRMGRPTYGHGQGALMWT